MSAVGAVVARLLGAEGLVEEIDPDTDAVKSLPETDVETEFHTRLLLMKDVRQLDDDGSVFGHFGKASVPAQEEGEIIANLGFTGVQAKRHRSISGGSQGGAEPPKWLPTRPEERTSSRRIGAHACRPHFGRRAAP